MGGVPRAVCLPFQQDAVKSALFGGSAFHQNYNSNWKAFRWQHRLRELSLTLPAVSGGNDLVSHIFPNGRTHLLRTVNSCGYHAVVFMSWENIIFSIKGGPARPTHGDGACRFTCLGKQEDRKNVSFQPQAEDSWHLLFAGAT